jgi:hypothetical protein
LTEWRHFDADKSGHLDALETVALVNELRGSPKRMIFRQFLAEEAQWQDHPTMRDRVLYLFDLFAPPHPRARPKVADQQVPLT